MSVRSASTYAVFNIDGDSFINNKLFLNYLVNGKNKRYYPKIFIKVN